MANSITYFVNYYNKCSVVPIFKSAAEDLLKNSGLSPVELLAKALAKSIVGHIISNLVVLRGGILDLFAYVWIDLVYGLSLTAQMDKKVFQANPHKTCT